MIAKASPNSQLTDEQEFTAEKLSAVDAIIKRYRSKPGSLKPVLDDVQEALGYLPKSIQRKIALGLGVPFSEVYGVVTFYSFFTMAPRGRHTVKCCLGMACYVRGGQKNPGKALRDPEREESRKNKRVESLAVFRA